MRRAAVLLLGLAALAALLLPAAEARGGTESMLQMGMRVRRGDGEDEAAAAGDGTGPSGAGDEDGSAAEDGGTAGEGGEDEAEGPSGVDDANGGDESSAPAMPSATEGSSSDDLENVEQQQQEEESSGAASDASSDASSSSSEAGPSMDEVMSGLLSGRVKTGRAQLTVAVGNKNYRQVSAKRTNDVRREQRVKKKAAATAEDMQEQTAKLAAEQTRKLREITRRERVAEGHNKAYELALRQKNKQHEERSEEATEKRVAREKAVADTLEMERAAAKEAIRLRKKRLGESIDLAEKTFERRVSFSRQRAAEQARKQIKRGTLDAERIARRGKYEEAAKERAFVRRQQLLDRRERKRRENDNKAHLAQIQRGVRNAQRGRARGIARSEQSRKQGLRRRSKRGGGSEQRRKRYYRRRLSSEQRRKRRSRGRDQRRQRMYQRRLARQQQGHRRERSRRSQQERSEQSRKQEQRAKRQPRWHTLPGTACFGARSSSGDTRITFPRYVSGRGRLPRTVTVTKWRLTHVSGGVSCATGAPTTNWGCTSMMGVFVQSYSPRYVIAPKAGTKNYVDRRIGRSWYTMSGYSATSKQVLFEGKYRVYTGRQIRLAYGETINSYTLGDNRGRSCARIEAFF